MTRLDAGALSLTRTALKILIALNWLRAALIAAGIVTTFVATDFVLRALGTPPADQGARLLNALRWVMAIGLVATPLYHLVLSRALGIVKTVGGGDPFVGENAERLKLCGWALLALQVLQIAVGWIANSVSTKALPIDIEGFSISGWLSVLLVFVLAQVFQHGARMRDDLAGTV